MQRGTRVGHDYTLVGGLRGPHKRMEAHIVTLTEGSEEFPPFQHPGTELLYMLEGEMVYRHEDSSYRMRPGDALQLDGEGIHGPRRANRPPRPLPVSTRLRHRRPRLTPHPAPPARPERPAPHALAPPPLPQRPDRRPTHPSHLAMSRLLCKLSRL